MPVFLGRGFGYRQPKQPGAEQADSRQEPEDRSPAEINAHVAAENRRQCRR